MAETQNNKVVLHRKEWQTMTPPDVANATLMFIAADPAGLSRFAMYVTSATVHYLYDHEQDAYLPIASGAFSPAIAAGACGIYHPWSPTYTATGGSTTTVTVALNTHNINLYAVGQQIEFLSGTAANLGQRRTITNVNNTGIAGSTITITFTGAVAGSVANNDTFRITSGSFFIFTSGAVATSFKRFDVATMSWGSTLSIANLAATWGTAGSMVTGISGAAGKGDIGGAIGAGISGAAGFAPTGATSNIIGSIGNSVGGGVNAAITGDV
jgi:hypothetical protein